MLETCVPCPEPIPAPVIAVFTKAVVAILVVLSPAVGVGACGFPVRTGDANGAKIFDKS